MSAPAFGAGSEPAPVKVHVTNAAEIGGPGKRPKRTVSTSSVSVTGPNAVSLVNQSPRRSRCTFTFVGGTASTFGYLCVSQGDAQGTGGANPQGAIVLNGMVLDYEGTDELWLGVTAGNTMAVGIVREFEGE
jgi:hypothetical protein